MVTIFLMNLKLESTLPTLFRVNEQYALPRTSYALRTMFTCSFITSMVAEGGNYKAEDLSKTQVEYGIYLPGENWQKITTATRTQFFIDRRCYHGVMRLTTSAFCVVTILGKVT